MMLRKPTPRTRTIRRAALSHDAFHYGARFHLAGSPFGAHCHVTRERYNRTRSMNWYKQPAQLSNRGIFMQDTLHEKLDALGETLGIVFTGLRVTRKKDRAGWRFTVDGKSLRF